MAKTKARPNNKIPNLTYTEPLVKQTRSHLGFEVRGATLIMNRFSDKSVHQMLAKHMGRDEARQKKIPREVIEQAIQRNETGAVAMPSTAFKKAILTAASAMKGFSKNKVPLRIGVFIKGASVPITYESMTPRMDITRLDGPSRAPDVRFRPQFNNWTARYVIMFDDAVTEQSTIIDLVDRSGNVGIGEWRPERNGDHGTFEISRLLSKDESQETMKLCAPIIRPITIPEWALDANLDLTQIQQILHENHEEEVA